MGRFGHWELLIIVFIAIVIFGGKRLPELGRGLGKGIANFRDSIKGREAGKSDAEAAEQVQELPVEEKVGLMFGIGLAEMVVIGVLGLVVLGPDDLPKIARQLGRGYQWMRQAAAEARAMLAVDLALNNDGLMESLKEAAKVPEEARSAVKNTVAEEIGDLTSLSKT